MTTPVFTGAPNQTTAVEIFVTDRLDGQTIGPTGLEASFPAGNPWQLHTFSVPRLGIVDIDYIIRRTGLAQRGAVGNRFLTFLEIVGPNAGDADAAVEVVDATNPDQLAIPLETIATFTGDRVVYLRPAAFIPQGGALRLNGMVASPGQPIKVRYHFCAVTCDRTAAVFKALCECFPNGNGPPAGPSLSGLAMGSGTLSGVGANPRYLWPGSSRDIAQGEFVYVPAPADGVIRAVVLTQQVPTTVPVATMEYTIVTTAPQPSSTITVGSEVSAPQINAGLDIPVSQGDPIAMEVVRSTDHPTMSDVIANILLEIA